MNGSQSTLTDRTPHVLNKDPTDKRPKFDKSSVILKHDFDQTGLVQRCVIIQRDENGFGLTVSGDNPVFVQLVKEDGAAMRAGVQTGDRIIKVNGNLVTHSNHIEVVKLIKSGSYVALTVLGRPPGLPQMALGEEEEKEEKEDGGNVSLSSALSGPYSHSTSCSDQENNTSPLLHRERVLECRNSESDGRLLPGEQGSSSRDDGDYKRLWTNCNSMHSNLLPESSSRRETPCQSPNVSRRDELGFCPSSDPEDTPTDSSVQCIVGSPPYHLNPQIIGAEDDYFDSHQEQLNGECSSFQSLDLLKCRPAHLAAFLHHVISQFDPAPVLCYLYADLHKQSSSKESRRFFMEFHSIFMDRAANLKVPVPETIASELERRRLDLIPEDLCKQYTQLLQDVVLPDLHNNLEDFRQKRSMGLTLAEDELCKLDSEREKDQLTLEKECCCAEHILSKIEDILLTSQPSEEEKCTTMQYVILTYMKHLGVKVKEPRGLEQKRGRINFLPKIKKSIRSEKEGEEKIKKPRFPNILVPPRRLSRVDSTSVGKAVELNRQCSSKLISQPSFSIPEQPESSAPLSGRIRGNLPSEESEANSACFPSTSSSPHSSPTGHASDTSGQTSDSNMSPFSTQPKLSETPQTAENQDAVSTLAGAQFDFSPSNTEPLQEEDQDSLSRMDAVSSADNQSEDDQGAEVDCEEDPLNWQALVSRGVLASLTPQEIKRQEVINELFYTERAHLRMLKVLDCVFCQRLNRHGILPPDDIRHIFTNLDEIIQLHASITEQMMTMRKMSETSVIGHIGDDLLSWFSGEEEEKIKGAAATFCSNQPSALEFIKMRKKKDQRFILFMKKAESNRLCRRLQLKDIIPVEMQRLTKYPLLLENIAKYTDDGEERDKVRKAAECCKKILNYVNQAVKEAENKQRLEEYQRRLDVSSLKQSENPMIQELKNLDLTKRRMVHEGPLSWKVHKEKTIELYTILLEDILVLLQKQDERLLLKFHGKNVAAATAADTKHTFSPVIKLNSVLVRPVATDNKSLFVLSMSENGAQIYELMAQTVSDQRTWQCLITQCADAMKAKPHNSDAPPAPADAEREAIEIIDREIPTARKHPNGSSPGSVRSSDKEVTSYPDTHGPPTCQNPFEGLKSEDEEDEAALAGGREEEEEVDEEELEAFLDGQLTDRLQEGSRGDVAIDNQEHGAFSVHESKAEDALKTLTMLKQVLFDHMMNRTSEEKKEDTEEERKRHGAPGASTSSRGSPEEPAAAPDENPPPADVQKEPQQPSVTGASETTEANGGFVILDFDAGPEESSTDDDGLGGSDVVIDMGKLLSSSSQTGGSGPNLNRQLMTYLRLLQADLEYLKEVEMKFNQLQQTLSDAATDSDDNTDGIQ